MFKIATLNINGLASRTKVEMLEEFLFQREIDILFLQEVAHSTIDKLRSYKIYKNMETAGRRTAMVTRNEITITNITMLPSERGITEEYRGICLINIYAPPGIAKRQERELFYNNELPYLLRTSPSNMIVGDFNCVLRQTALDTPNIVRRSTY